MPTAWKGTISFGLVNIPINLYPAFKSKEMEFHLLDRLDHGRIGYRKICRKWGRVLKTEEIAKALEHEKDANIEAIRSSGKIGVGKIQFGNREHLAALKADGLAILLKLKHFVEDLEDPKLLNFPPLTAEAGKKELELARQLVTTLRGTFDPEEFRDTRRARPCGIPCPRRKAFPSQESRVTHMVPGTLKPYRRKRDFYRSAEPEGKVDPGNGRLRGRQAARGHSRGGRLVFHEHHASRLHFDLRLEMGGGLESWAAPEGPSLDPKDRRLAVQTEDHPVLILPYGSRKEKPGNLEGTEGPSAKAGSGGRVAAGPMAPPKAGSRKARPGTGKAAAPGPAAESRSMEKPAPRKWPPGAVPAPLPDFVGPMLATLVDRPFDDGDWVFESRWDGWRAQLRFDGKTVGRISRSGKSLDAMFPELKSLHEGLKARSCVIEGEVVALEDQGRSRFQLLQYRLKGRKRPEDEGHVVFYAFDARMLKEVHALLAPLRTGKCPFAETPKTNGKVEWLKPLRVGEAEFAEWTGDGRMRQPVFMGMRPDKDPKACVREVEEPAGKAKAGLTNLDKVYWPGEGYTKGDLIRYYDTVSPWLLPHLKDRPLHLANLGLIAFPKTSGSRGIHLYVPLKPVYTFAQGLDFARLVAGWAVQQMPGSFTVERSLKIRKRDRVYLDCMQNSRGKSVASAYSVRERPGACVSAPLLWSELKEKILIEDFNIRSMPGRLEKKGDLFESVLKAGNSLDRALKKLERILKE